MLEGPGDRQFQHPPWVLTAQKEHQFFTSFAGMIIPNRNQQIMSKSQGAKNEIILLRHHGCFMYPFVHFGLINPIPAWLLYSILHEWRRLFNS
jgi:hypothetical protein